MNNIQKTSFLKSLTCLMLMMGAGSLMAQSHPEIPDVPGGVAKNAIVQAIDNAQATSGNQSDTSIVYKQISASGAVSYTDKPVKGLKIDKVIEVDLRSTSTWSTSPGAMPKGIYSSRSAIQKDESAAQRLSERKVREGQSIERLQVAENSLQKASQEFDQSKEPLEGERTRNVNGTSRLNEAYFQRQEANQAALKAAELEYDQSLSGARNAN